MATPLWAGGADGGYWQTYADRGFNILLPGLTQNREGLRRHHFAGSFSDDEYQQQQVIRQFNISAWANYLQQDLVITERMLYRRQGLYGTEEPLTEQEWQPIPPEVKQYITLAQTQEPLVVQPTKHKHADFAKAIESLQDALQDTESAFLKQRYVYLILRLAHYSKQYTRVETLYQQFAKQRQQPNAEISRWIDALYAGALQRQGKLAEAAYLFAKIYPHSQTRPLEARLNFKIKTDQQWQQLMALCQSDDEKALMHFMRSLKAKANTQYELQAMYEVAPNSAWVDEALVRELEFVQFARDYKLSASDYRGLAMIEPSVLIQDLNENKPAKRQQVQQRRKDYLQALSDLLQRIRREGKREDVFLTQFAQLYVRLLQGERVTLTEVNDFQAQYSQDARAKHTLGLEYYTYLANLDGINDTIEQKISTYLAQLKPIYNQQDSEYQTDGASFYQNIMAYTYIKLEPFYLAQKADWQPTKTYAARNRGYIDLDNTLVVELRDFKRLLTEDEAQQSALLQEMLREIREVAQHEPLDTVIARKYLAANMPKKAMQAIADLPPEVAKKHLSKSEYNPFSTSLAGHNRKPGTEPKTLQQVVETLLTLHEQIAKNPKDAQAYFLLGTLAYNMTWFGNSPLLVRYHRSTNNWSGGALDFSRAKKYYALALKHSPSRNFSAKVLYALAKIEANEFMIAQDKKASPTGYGYYSDYRWGSTYRERVLAKKAAGLGEYLKRLNDYEDTGYFREVIGQCADYNYFHSQ